MKIYHNSRCRKRECFKSNSVKGINIEIKNPIDKDELR